MIGTVPTDRTRRDATGARGTVGAPGGPAPAAGPDGADLVRLVRRGVLVAFAAAAVLVPVALALAKHPRWWEWIAPEQTPMTWLQSVVLVTAGATAALLALVVRLREGPRREVLVWLLLAAGAAALAVDERFALHERVRDRVLAPRDITIPFLPWVGPGDFLVLGVAVVGLALLPTVWRAVAADRAARRLLVAGAVLALAAVGIDSVDPSSWSIDAERRQQTGEEIVELWAMLCLLAAVAFRLLGELAVLAHLARPGTGRRDRTLADDAR